MHSKIKDLREVVDLILDSDVELDPILLINLDSICCELEGCEEELEVITE